MPGPLTSMCTRPPAATAASVVAFASVTDRSVVQASVAPAEPSSCIVAAILTPSRVKST